MASLETPAVAHLAGGAVPYILRRSERARGVRVVIHRRRGVVVTVPARRVAGPAAGRQGVEQQAVAFLAAREPWLRRHLARQAETRAVIQARGGARDGGCLPFLGRLHAVRVVPAVSGLQRSHVVQFEAFDERGSGESDQLVIHRVARERRTDGAVLEAWFRAQARAAIDASVARHAPALGVNPMAVAMRDPRSRWGSASRVGRLSFSWRLILAPPEALETVVVHELAHLRVFGHGPAFWALVAARRPDYRTWRRWLHDHASDIHGALGDGAE
ncbi:MAG: SprT family zinc-dependent metalloprotease [Candidatus Limnocylindrales bacterium]